MELGLALIGADEELEESPQGPVGTGGWRRIGRTAQPAHIVSPATPGEVPVLNLNSQLENKGLILDPW